MLNSKRNWKSVLQELNTDAELEWLMIRPTVNCAHQHAAGKKTEVDEYLGSSKGGFSTKLYATVDVLENSVQFYLGDFVHTA